MNKGYANVTCHHTDNAGNPCIYNAENCTIRDDRVPQDIKLPFELSQVSQANGSWKKTLQECCFCTVIVFL